MDGSDPGSSIPANSRAPPSNPAITWKPNKRKTIKFSEVTKMSSPNKGTLELHQEPPTSPSSHRPYSMKNVADPAKGETLQGKAASRVLVSKGVSRSQPPNDMDEDSLFIPLDVISSPCVIMQDLDSRVMLDQKSKPPARSTAPNPESGAKHRRWREEFINLPRSYHDEPQCYIHQSIKPVAHALIAIATTVGAPACIQQTHTQWKTITSKAPRVSDIFKKAVFWRYGTIVKQPNKDNPATFKFLFIPRFDILKHEDILSRAPVPLLDWCSSRRAFKGASKAQHEHRLQASTGNVNYETQPLGLTGQDFSFVSRAVEEEFNDSECVRGRGVVAVNQKHADIESLDDERPFSLSPGNYASKDFTLPLRKYVYADGTCASSDSQKLQLQWCGLSALALKVLHIVPGVSPSIALEIYFDRIISIKYNVGDRKLMISYNGSDHEESIAEHPSTLLLDLYPAQQEAFLQLKSACYKLSTAGGGKRTCDREEGDFFDEQEQKLVDSRKKRMLPKSGCSPQSQTATRHQGAKRRHGISNIFGINRSVQSKLSQHFEVPSNKDKAEDAGDSGVEDSNNNVRQTLARGLESVISEALEADTASDLHLPASTLPISTFSPPRRRNSVPSSSKIVRKNSSNVGRPQAKKRRKTSPEVTLSSKSPTSLRLFYKTISPKDDQIQVAIGDTVVRGRTELEVGGKRDKYDVFDGPWVICKLAAARKIYSLPEVNEESDTETSEDQKAHNIRKMLTTLVMLKFPPKSRAKPWVALNQLLPVVDAKGIMSGKVFASSSIVAELEVFKALQGSILAGVNHPNLSMASTNDDGDADSELISLVKLGEKIHVAVTHVDPQAVAGDCYEVEKLRGKRLRLYGCDDEVVYENKWKTDQTDPWIQRLLRQFPGFLQDKIAVAEFKVHWAGWPDEDDSWEVAADNIPQSFVVEFNKLTDPYRELEIEHTVLAADMFLENDLKSWPQLWRTGKAMKKQATSKGKYTSSTALSPEKAGASAAATGLRSPEIDVVQESPSSPAENRNARFPVNDQVDEDDEDDEDDDEMSIDDN